MDTPILLMDEAFSALDPLNRTQMQDELLALQTKLRKTILFITHDFDEALKLGTRIAILRDGAVVQVGRPEEIVLSPANDHVEAFVRNVSRARAIPLLRGDGERAVPAPSGCAAGDCPLRGGPAAVRRQ